MLHKTAMVPFLETDGESEGADGFGDVCAVCEDVVVELCEVGGGGVNG